MRSKITDKVYNEIKKQVDAAKTLDESYFYQFFTKIFKMFEIWDLSDKIDDILNENFITEILKNKNINENSIRTEFFENFIYLLFITNDEKNFLYYSFKRLERMLNLLPEFHEYYFCFANKEIYSDETPINYFCKKINILYSKGLISNDELIKILDIISKKAFFIRNGFFVNTIQKNFPIPKEYLINNLKLFTVESIRLNENFSNNIEILKIIFSDIFLENLKNAYTISTGGELSEEIKNKITPEFVNSLVLKNIIS